MLGLICLPFQKWETHLLPSRYEEVYLSQVKDHLDVGGGGGGRGGASSA